VYGRWFVVGSFVAAAIITPPDITSQVMMAIPMVVLYGGSIVLAYIFGKKPSEEQMESFRKSRKQKKLDREREKERRRREEEAEKNAV
ncbi:MAG: twin-arginine translocase subunit TatC, partial [Myxococcota bacterium]